MAHVNCQQKMNDFSYCNSVNNMQREKERIIEASVVVLKLEITNCSCDDLFDDLFTVLTLSFNLSDEEAESIVDSAKEKLSHSAKLSTLKERAEHFDSQSKEVRTIVSKLVTDILTLKTAKVVSMVLQY